MEFNSTSIYSNKYDLDQIDVFQEGFADNPMYFSVNGLPNQLSFGKHYFYLSILNPQNQDHQLRNGSRILFEFKSINGVVLKSDVTEIRQQNGVATCFVEVLQNPLRTYKEIEDGEGTLTIVGSLENKSTTRNLIPKKFKDAMNYRCTFPIEIRKNLINADSPIVTNITHKRTTIKGQFSFVKASIPTKKYAPKGTTYSTDGSPNAGTSERDTGDSPT